MVGSLFLPVGENLGEFELFVDYKKMRKGTLSISARGSRINNEERRKRERELERVKENVRVCICAFVRVCMCACEREKEKTFQLDSQKKEKRIFISQDQALLKRCAPVCKCSCVLVSVGACGCVCVCVLVRVSACGCECVCVGAGECMWV